MWCLVIRNDDVVFGPFYTERQALDYAKDVYYTDAEEYEHADTNADFYVCELRKP